MQSQARWLRPCWWALLGLLSSSTASIATPYAAALTNIGGGQITFTLNEAADQVTVIFNSGARTDFHSPAAGSHTFSRGGEDDFRIVVEKSAPPGWRQGVIQQISSDSEPTVQYIHPRGVCVNRNPASPHFGRVYVSMSLPVTNGSPANAEEGIYSLSPNLTNWFEGARTAGLDFAEPDNNALSPFRLSVGPDDMLYICDLSPSTGTLYITDPEVNSGNNVFGLRIGGDFPIGTNRIRGSISAAYVEGSSAQSNLVVWVVDEDRQPNREDTNPTTRNSIWQWPLMGESLPASNALPVRLTGSPLAGFQAQLADLARGPDGKFYASQLRGASFGAPGATTPGLFVVTPDGSSNMWNSLTASRAVLQNPSGTDILTDTCAIDVSHDGKYAAVLRTNNSRIHVLPLNNGLPDLTNRIHLVTLPAIGPAQDIAFDAANNIYYVSASQGLLRVLSAGGTSRAVTHSDGTFEIEFDIEPEVINIVGVTWSSTVVEIDFTSSVAAVPGDFTVESTPSLNPVTWAVEDAATIIAMGGGFRATMPLDGDVRCYRVRR